MRRRKHRWGKSKGRGPAFVMLVALATVTVFGTGGASALVLDSMQDDGWEIVSGSSGGEFLRFEENVGGRTVRFDLLKGSLGVLELEMTVTNLLGQSEEASVIIDRSVRGSRTMSFYGTDGQLLRQETTATTAAASSSGCDEACDDVSNAGEACGAFPDPAQQAACLAIHTLATGAYCLFEGLFCAFVGEVYDPDFPCEAMTHHGTIAVVPNVVAWKEPYAAAGTGWPIGKVLEAFVYWPRMGVDDEVRMRNSPGGSYWVGTTGTGNWTYTFLNEYWNKPTDPVPAGWTLLCMRSGGGPADRIDWTRGNTVATCYYSVSPHNDTATIDPTYKPASCSYGYGVGE